MSPFLIASEALFCGMAVCAIAPAILFAFNLRRFRAPQPADIFDGRVAVLIPARDEAANIAACLHSILASRGLSQLEVLVLDDASRDNTAAIVNELAASDSRVRLLEGRPLPAGWNGKQHACWQLANAATAPLVLFLDADVRLTPACIASCCHERAHRNVALLSGFPRQIFSNWLDRLLLPLIHFVLLSYLPMRRMQRSTSPAYSAGCGQFMLAERAAYFAAGGHAAIRETRHDGIRLPQLFRQHNLRTDIADLTTLATVRMYSTPRETWNGLAKNATEGMAAPSRIWIFTIFLTLGQILPTLILLCVPLFAVALGSLGMDIHVDGKRALLVAASFFVFTVFSGYATRLIAARRFKQPLLSALLHPLGVLVLLILQWYALIRQLAHKPIEWRARTYSD